ncbi:hypothetical protein Tco_0656465 [Tanacetum coccineum]|uniref:DUF4283 domain-containing protein n=1 Tax=Tanacetum coccineum TaxID=301880 RepID=A0ABQ4XA45_9ASTR
MGGPRTCLPPREANNIVPNVLNIAEIFGVPFNTFTDIEDLINGIEMGKHEAVWLTLTAERRKDVMDSIAPSHESPIVQSVDINTKSTFYAGVAGASAKDQPKINYNFRPLIADLVFDGVNISIPRKVFKKEQLGETWAEKNYDEYHRLLEETRLLKEELTRILIWVKLHNVTIQVFEEDEADLVDVVTIGIPSLTRDGFTKETIHVEYKWRPPMCDVCKIFGHVHDHYPKKVSSPPTVVTSNVVTPAVEKTNDGFQMVGKKKKRKGKSKSTNGGHFAGPLVKPNVRYELKVTTSTPKKAANNVGNASKSSSMWKTTGASSKNDNIITSIFYSALNDDNDDEEEDVENVYDEMTNLFSNIKIDGSSSFTDAVG